MILKYRKICFLCGNEMIEGEKRDKEHIIPNFILGNLEIKNKKNYFRKEDGEESGKEYSKKKLSVHEICNKKSGQKIENTLSDFDNLNFKDYCDDYINDKCETEIAMIFLMIKIYYGLFYYDYLNTEESKEKIQELSKRYYYEVFKKFIIEGETDFLDELYLNSFFSIEIDSEGIDDFDLTTFIDEEIILIKYKKRIFVLVIGDDQEILSYVLNKFENLSDFSKHIKKGQREIKNYNAFKDIGLFVYALKKSIIKVENQIMEFYKSGRFGFEYKIDEEKFNHTYSYLTKNKK